MFSLIPQSWEDSGTRIQKTPKKQTKFLTVMTAGLD